jgi:hypothetical protein
LLPHNAPQGIPLTFEIGLPKPSQTSSDRQPKGRHVTPFAETGPASDRYSTHILSLGLFIERLNGPIVPDMHRDTSNTASEGESEEQAPLPVNERAAAIARGVQRLFGQLDIRSILELPLNNNRRVDVVGLDKKGRLIFVEVKSSLNDFRTDDKWREYLGHCDEFYFAVDTDFPSEVLPSEWGLILADRYGGEVVRPSPQQNLHASRRKAVTLDFARSAASRLQQAEDDL